MRNWAKSQTQDHNFLKSKAKQKSWTLYARKLAKQDFLAIVKNEEILQNFLNFFTLRDVCFLIFLNTNKQITFNQSQALLGQLCLNHQTGVPCENNTGFLEWKENQQMCHTGNMISLTILNPLTYIALKTNISISFMEPICFAFSE